MALGIRASNTGSVSGGTSISVTKPTGTTSGDQLLFLLSKDDSDTPTAPTGFTIQSGAGGVTTTSEGQAYTKTAGGSEPASYSISWSGAEDGVAAVLCIQDTTGIDITAEDVASTNRTTGTVSGTVTNNSSLAIVYCASEDSTATFTAPDGTWTQLGSTLTVGSGVTGAAMAIFYKTLNSGSTGSLTFTQSVTQELVVGMIVYAPAASGAYTLDTSTGTFTLTGTATGLKVSRKIAAATQSYTLTGTATGLRAGRKLAATTATYALTGITTPLQAARKLPVTTGTFTLTGVAAGLSRAYPFVVSTGSFTLSGIATVLQAARKIAATTATYTLTGTNSGVTAQRNLAGGTGSFTLTGIDAAITAQRALAAGTGAFVLTGVDADLTYTPAAGAYTLDAEPGAFVLTGNDADLEYQEASTGVTHYQQRDKYPRWVVIGDKAHYVRSAAEENRLTAEFDQQETQPKRDKRKKPKELPFSAIALESLPEIEAANEGLNGSTLTAIEGANGSTLPIQAMDFMADTQAIMAQMQADEAEEEEMMIMMMAA